MSRLATRTAFGVLIMSPATLSAQTASYDPAPGVAIDFAALREEAAREASPAAAPVLDLARALEACAGDEGLGDF